MTIHVMVGIPGSGKSTYARQLEKQGAVRVSLDEIREKLEVETGSKSEPKVFSEGLKQMKATLEENKDVVCDSTNVTPKKRAEYFKVAKKYGAKTIAIFVNTDKKECLERNSKREGNAKVPAVAIHTAAKRLIPPTEEEGFDMVIIL